MPEAGRVDIAAEAALLVKDVALEQGGDGDEEARAADADGRLVANGEVHRLQRVGIDAEVVDCAGRGAHSVGDAASLKGRARRAGGAHQPFAVADHDLGIGADIHVQGQLFGPVHAAAHDAGDDIAAHVAGDRWIDQGHGGAREVQAEIRGADRRKQGGDRHIRRPADVIRLQFEEKMGHGGVAGQGYGGDFVPVHPGLLDHALDDPVDGLHQHLVQPTQPPRLFRVDDAGDHVFAVGKLAVVVSAPGQDLAGGQIQQVAVDRGGADVDGQAETAFRPVTRLDIDHHVLAGGVDGTGQGGGDEKVFVPQGAPELAQGVQGDDEPPLVVLVVQPLHQTGGVGPVVSGRGGRQLEDQLFHWRHEDASLLHLVDGEQVDPGPVPGGHVDGQAATGHLGLGRDPDHQVCLCRRPAGLAVATAEFRG